MDVFPYATGGNEEDAALAFKLLMYMAYSTNKQNKLYKTFEKQYITRFYKDPKPESISEEELPTSVSDLFTQWIQRKTEDEYLAYIKAWSTPIEKLELTLQDLENISDDPEYRQALRDTIHYKIIDKKCQFFTQYGIHTMLFFPFGGKNPRNHPEMKHILLDQVDFKRLLEDYDQLVKIPKDYPNMGQQITPVRYELEKANSIYSQLFSARVIPLLIKFRPEVEKIWKGGKRRKTRKARKSKKAKKSMRRSKK
jgi:hypothetical protein